MRALRLLISPAAFCLWAICACLAFSIAGSNASRTVVIKQETKSGTASASFPIDMRRQDEDLFKLLTARKKSDMADFLKGAEQSAANKSNDEDAVEIMPWDQSVRYIEQFRAPTLVSYLEVTATATGQAQAATAFKTVNFDKAAKRELTLGDLFDGVTDRAPVLVALANYVRAALKDEAGEDEDSPALIQATEADLSVYEHFTFCPSTKTGKSAGLTVHFAPNAISTYPESDFHVTVPYTVFAKFLKPGMRPLFAGEPRQTEVALQDAD